MASRPKLRARQRLPRRLDTDTRSASKVRGLKNRNQGADTELAFPMEGRPQSKTSGWVLSCFLADYAQPQILPIKSTKFDLRLSCEGDYLSNEFDGLQMAYILNKTAHIPLKRRYIPIKHASINKF